VTVTEDNDLADLAARLHALESQGVLPWEPPLPRDIPGIDNRNGLVQHKREQEEKRWAELAKDRETAEERAREERLRIQAEETAERQRQERLWRHNRFARVRAQVRLRGIRADLAKLDEDRQSLVDARAECQAIIDVGIRPHGEDDE
jgi:hypothetical protein